MRKSWSDDNLASSSSTWMVVIMEATVFRFLPLVRILCSLVWKLQNEALELTVSLTSPDPRSRDGSFKFAENILGSLISQMLDLNHKQSNLPDDACDQWIFRAFGYKRTLTMTTNNDHKHSTVRSIVDRLEFKAKNQGKPVGPQVRY